MEPITSPITSEAHRRPRTTRELVAGASLIVFGGLGAFLPFLSGALLGTIVGSSVTGLEALATAGQIAMSIPLICIVALVVASGLYRQAPWGRAAAITVGVLLAASPVAHVVGSGVGASGPVSLVHLGAIEATSIPPLLAAVLYHLFATPVGAPPYSLVVVVPIGIVVLAALLRGGRAMVATAAVPGKPVRRPSTAMLLLLVTGILSIGPYVSWLLSAAIPRTAVAHGGPAPDAGIGDAAAIGLLYAIPGAMGSIGALAAARSIHARASYGPWIAPAASLIAGGWSAMWIALLAAVMFAAGESAPTALGWFLFGVVLVCAASFFVVTASVYRRRAWFTGSAAARSPGRRRPGRFWTVTSGVGGALVLPLALSLATSIGRPELPHIDFGAVLFNGVQYHYAGPVNVPDDRLSVAGELEAWDEGLGIDDPTVYNLDALPATLVIGLYDHQGPGDGSLAAYVPLATSVDEHGSFVVPGALCPYVDLETPGVSVQPCGPPGFVTLDGLDYVDTGNYVVTPADIAPTTNMAVAPAAPDPRVDLTVHAIRGVPIGEAFALRVGSRVVVYQTGIFPAELCRYSPAAVSDPLQAKLRALDDGIAIDGGDKASLVVPFGCEFPSAVRFGGQIYLLEDRTLELLDVPRSAVTPIGVGLATDPGEAAGGKSEHPFPPTLDDTVYAIAGVDPSVAVAFAVRDRYIALRGGGEGLPVPPELCPYVRADVVEQYIADGLTDVGCP